MQNDQSMARSVNGSVEAPRTIWFADGDFAVADSQPAGFAAEVVSLGFLKTALRRSAWVWCGLAVLGMVAVVGYKVAKPASYHAATTILLPGDEQNPDLILTDAALAQSRTVAGLAERTLGLDQTPESFAGTYNVTSVTGQVLVITSGGPSGAQAVRNASAIAAAFLHFRSGLQRADQRLALSTLDVQISQSEEQIRALTKQIRDLNAQPSSAANQSKLSDLQTQLGQATNALTGANADVQATGREAALQLKESRVLDPPALLPRSRKKSLALAAAIGLIAGLMLGLAIVIIRAVVSDRLRQRDDIAHALGAPVALSVGLVRPWARILALGPPGLKTTSKPEIRRIVALLQDMVATRASKPGTLAVVAIDDTEAPSLALVSLALSCAEQGAHVVLADLAVGAPAARLLRCGAPGVHDVAVPAGQLTVAIPGPGDVVLNGPMAHNAKERAEMTKDLSAACNSADLVLTLATLDPALGGDHLATWSDEAVAFVTAGRSSWTRIRSVSEMLQLAGIRLTVGVLVGADGLDESLGVISPIGAGRHAGAA